MNFLRNHYTEVQKSRNELPGKRFSRRKYSKCSIMHTKLCCILRIQVATDAVVSGHVAQIAAVPQNCRKVFHDALDMSLYDA